MKEAKDIREKSMISRAWDSKDYLSILERKDILATVSGTIWWR